MVTDSNVPAYRKFKISSPGKDTLCRFFLCGQRMSVSVHNPTKVGGEICEGCTQSQTKSKTRNWGETIWDEAQ